MIEASAPPYTTEGICDCNNDNIPGGGRYASANSTFSSSHSIIPNPFHDRLVLKVLKQDIEQTQPANIIVRNVHGKTVYVNPLASNDLTIETTTWAAGIYTISIIKGTNKQVRKMSKY